MNETEFQWDDERFPLDENRAIDGKDLTKRYVRETESISSLFDAPCSILEMMIALCIRLETHILFRPGKKSHVKTIFWSMVDSMMLSGMDDFGDDFDEEEAKLCVFTMQEHTYMPNGYGGMFTVPGRSDMRNKEIWYQAMAWLEDNKEEFNLYA